TWAADMSWLALATTAGLLTGAGLGWLGLMPRCSEWVVSGPRLLEGKDAEREAKRRSPTARERLADRFALALHPSLWLKKGALSRHLLLHGSVGSGKTQVLLALLQQIVRIPDASLFLYDVKGDFTSKLPNGTI